MSTQSSTFNSASIQNDNQVLIQEPHEGETMEALAIREDSSALMPVMSIETATERYKTIVQYVQRLMHEGSDFGRIPGTEKNTLLKPGAEKLCTLFGLSKRFTLVEHVEDWTGNENQTGEPFFNYLYRCGLYRGETLIAESDGSCNSRETKYRWRNAQRVCPGCNQPTIFASKNDDGFYCWAKKGGCGAKFGSTDERITSQQTGRVPNPDIADQVNTIQKMAQKRALIGATLLAVNASEFFTQDMDDFVDTPREEKPVQQKQSEPVTVSRRAPAKANISESRRVLIQSVADAFKLLNDKGYTPQWTKKSANEFVALHFGGAAGVDQLDDSQVSDLLRILSEKIDGMKATGGEARQNLIATIKAYFATEELLNNFLKDHDGKRLEEMTDQELAAIYDEVSIPF